MSKTSPKSSTAARRLGRSSVTGGFIMAPYPKKGGIDPKKIEAVVKLVTANRKDA